jgi:hypothetical protein
MNIEKNRSVLLHGNRKEKKKKQNKKKFKLQYISFFAFFFLTFFHLQKTAVKFSIFFFDSK